MTFIFAYQLVFLFLNGNAIIGHVENFVVIYPNDFTLLLAASLAVLNALTKSK